MIQQTVEKVIIPLKVVTELKALSGEPTNKKKP
jgi:hypothetical protein